MASRKGIPNKNRKDLAAIIEKAISTKDRMMLLAELARGVQIEEKDGDDIKIYSKAPDAKAIEQLNAYQYGKPAQVMSLKNEDNKPFLVKIDTR